MQPPLYHEAAPRVQLQAAPPEEEEEQQQKDDLYGILMDVADEVINADVSIVTTIVEYLWYLIKVYRFFLIDCTN